MEHKRVFTVFTPGCCLFVWWLFLFIEPFLCCIDNRQFYNKDITFLVRSSGMGETGGGGQTGAEAFHLEGPEFRKAFVNLQVPAITCLLFCPA